MVNSFRQYGFEENVLREMDNFKEDFLSNQYKKDTSGNKGPNYRENGLLSDSEAFEQYLNDEESHDFLDME